MKHYYVTVSVPVWFDADDDVDVSGESPMINLDDRDNAARHARQMTYAWKTARNIVARVYPEARYQFSEAGPYIEIKLNATTGLVFGIALDEIGASVCDIIGDEWEPTGDALDTPCSSDSEDGEAIAAAILKATLEYHHDIRKGFDNSADVEHDAFEQAREFDRTHPGHWEWVPDDEPSA